MSDNFSTFIENERARLNESRESLLAERQSIDARIAALGNEFAAISAYEAAKAGKPSATTARRPRARNGSRRQDIIDALGTAPLNAGLSRGALIERLGLKGDKAGEMSLSNALTAMQKSGQVVRQDDGRWAIVAPDGLRRAAE